MGNFQRALVFQGGGALGAYEAGTYQQMYRKVSRESTDGRLFDIVAGTSIGAINSSVLVGHYLKNNSWEGSADKLLEFWEGLISPTIADRLFTKDSPVRNSWDYLRTFNHDIADAEYIQSSNPLVGFDDQSIPVGDETTVVMPCLLNLNLCSCITSKRYFWCPKLIPPPSFNAHIPPLDNGIGPSRKT